MTLSTLATSTDGGTALSWFDVETINTAPDAVEDATVTDEDTAVIIDLRLNDTDLEGDILSVTQIDGQDIAVGESIDVGYGTVTLNADGTVTFDPDENWNGSESFEYTITDGIDTDTATANITVDAVNDGPVANDDAARTDEDTAITLDLRTNDSDIDGDSLTVTQIDGQDIVVGGSVDVGYGIVTLNADGTVTFDPDANWNGSESFEYTVSDGTTTDTATANITVDAVNDAPVANDDTATTDENTAVTLDLRTNDTDLEGDNLTVTQIDGQDIAVGGSVDVGNGTVTLNADGTVTFNPDADFDGIENFEYTVSDGTATATATAEVTVEDVGGGNNAPIAGDDLFIFGAGDGSDYFAGGDGWSDTIQLEGIDGGPGADAGWAMQVEDGVVYTETENGLEFEVDASGSIKLSDGSELTFEGVDKIEW